MNFREGVEVVFHCRQLRIEAKIVKPRVLKSTEMELVTPNLLDWWVLANRRRPCKELNLSVTLICAGAKDDEDIGTTFELSAVEESETELLHTIIALHRQLVRSSLEISQDRETELETKKRTLTLLNLEQPSTVAPSEHLALSVIYMLCDLYGYLPTVGMDIIRQQSGDGHDMLHLAVIQGQATLVKEIARHALAWYQAHSLTEDRELFARNANGHTALDFAMALGHEEIELILVEKVAAASEIKEITI
ncbi:hypothetical protein BGZ99_005526 [Dissophora globulifera]|uniref:Uncharacterized protein n=1 Tax=Dissophora globulifera TaxID=979702 RepID=A0A9P6RXB2_9FUNG|nr:hypothetical protein BGZ99_005526 [Dissophora globulifera]